MHAQKMEDVPNLTEKAGVASKGEDGGSAGPSDSGNLPLGMSFPKLYTA
jgi:hypothetical protein